MDGKSFSPFLKQLLPTTREPNKGLDQLARAVIGAAIEVHRHLGAGLQEPLYAPALQIELSLRSIPFETEVILPVSYKGRPLGTRKLDLLVGGALIVELKSVEALAPIHTSTWTTNKLQCSVVEGRGKESGVVLISGPPALQLA